MYWILCECECESQNCKNQNGYKFYFTSFQFREKSFSVSFCFCFCFCFIFRTRLCQSLKTHTNNGSVLLLSNHERFLQKMSFKFIFFVRSLFLFLYKTLLFDGFLFENCSVYETWILNVFHFFFRFVSEKQKFLRKDFAGKLYCRLAINIYDWMINKRKWHFFRAHEHYFYQVVRSLWIIHRTLFVNLIWQQRMSKLSNTDRNFQFQTITLSAARTLISIWIRFKYLFNQEKKKQNKIKTKLRVSKIKVVCC